MVARGRADQPGRHFASSFQEDIMTRTAPFTTGFALCVLLGLADVVGVAGMNMDGAPPWHGSRPAMLTVVVSRALSGLLSLPAFFLDAPTWAQLVAAGLFILTVVGVGLLAGATRHQAVAETAR
jgi:hypothetical protein